MSTVPEFAPWPVFEVDDVEAAADVLRSGRVNYWSGTEGVEFEREFAKQVEAKYAIATSSGTAALEMALHGLSLNRGDEVIVPSRAFIATAAAVALSGGVPVCADIDRDSGNLTGETIEAQLTDRTRGIIAVHMAGWPCDMDPILELADQRDLFVLEDCGQSQGASYKQRPVGAIGDVGVFSFCQDKILTTAGEGGMLVTNREDVFRRAWALKEHGRAPEIYRDRDARAANSLNESIFDDFGSNRRMTEFQSAVGRSMLRKVPSWIETRRRYAHQLADACEAAGLRTPLPDHDVKHAFYRLYAYIEPASLGFGWTRDRLVQAIRDRGVPCLAGTDCEIYRENAFHSIRKRRKRLQVAAELGERSLCWLVHPTLSQAAIDYCGDVIMDVMADVTGRANRIGRAA